METTFRECLEAVQSAAQRRRRTANKSTGYDKHTATMRKTCIVSILYWRTVHPAGHFSKKLQIIAKRNLLVQVESAPACCIFWTSVHHAFRSYSLVKTTGKSASPALMGSDGDP